MEISKTEKYTLIKPSENSVINFLENFKNKYANFTEEHLIIDFSDKINTKIEELLLFLDLSVRHKENGTSFVMICNGIDIDEIPEEISVAPTFNEAIDILEMDAIERDLGF